MEKFTKIFTAVSRKQLGMSLVEVAIATAITLTASATAYNQISDNRNSESSPSFRELTSNIHSHVDTILGKLLKPVDGAVTSCVSNSDIDSLASGTFNTTTGKIVRYTGSGGFSKNVEEMADAYCHSGMKCFVRTHLLSTKDDDGKPVMRPTAYTLFGAKAVSVTIDRKIVESCDNTMLAQSNLAPGLKYIMQTAEANSGAMSKKLQDLLIGDLPTNAKILATIYSGGGGDSGESGGVQPRHYWIDWYLRYVNFDKIPMIGQGLLYGYKTESAMSRVRIGKSNRNTMVEYVRMWYTYGCSLQQITAGDTQCRCFVAVDNGALAASANYTAPPLCISTNPYGNEQHPGGFLAAYSD